MKKITLTALLLTVAIPVAHAQGVCDKLVIDSANVISDVARVETAAKALEGAGATVRVRTTASLDGAPNLDKYIFGVRDNARS